jgi:pyruvate,orthophosphate dikinase
MPGMMDTVLNLGLNPETVEGIARRSGEERFAWDSYRRFVQMYGDVVMGLKPESKEDEDPFELLIHEMKKKRGVKNDTELTARDLQSKAGTMTAPRCTGCSTTFPRSGARRSTSRRWFTATSVTTAPPAWHLRATPATAKTYSTVNFSLTPRARTSSRRENYPSLEEIMPEVYRELSEIETRLENHYKDMQDLEFTIQEGKLWLLQTRNGKRTGTAMVKIAMDMLRDAASTTCCTQFLTGRRKTPPRCSPRVFPPRQGPPAAASSFSPMRRRRGPTAAKKSSSSAWRPRPRTCAA